jgi:hypothetical protein
MGISANFGGRLNAGALGNIEAQPPAASPARNRIATLAGAAPVTAFAPATAMNPALLAAIAATAPTATPTAPTATAVSASAATPAVSAAGLLNRADLFGNLAGINPGIIVDPGRFTPLPFPLPTPMPTQHTTSELARSSISILNGASADVLREAINIVTARRIEPTGLLDFLERRVRVGEVLNQLARDWSETTRSDFSDAFQLDRTHLDAMDAIVALAILTDPQLDDEILAENTPQTSTADLTDNRVVVDQHPRPGTPLQAPYIILLAVEYRAVAQAQDVVRGIMDQLVDHQGFKLPRPAMERIRGG